MFSRPLIFGLDESIDSSPFMTSDEVYRAVGLNSGNLVFHYATSCMMAEKLPSIPWSGDVDFINRKGDVVIMPLANQIGNHQDMGGLAKKLAKIDLPIVAHGLGAQCGLSDSEEIQVPEGTINWLRELAAHAPTSSPNIAVRGRRTYKLLCELGFEKNIVMLGCPSHLINPSTDLGCKIYENLKRPARRLGVAAGHYRWEHLRDQERQLATLITKYNGSYIVQSPLEMVQLARGDFHEMTTELIEECRDYICPHLSLEQFQEWARNHAKVFFNVPGWMEHLRGMDIVVGPRIHGVMLALQVGIPSLCLVHDYRTLELCEIMKVPYIYAADFPKHIELGGLAKLIEFDPDEFDRNRNALRRSFRDFLRSNGLDARR